MGTTYLIVALSRMGATFTFTHSWVPRSALLHHGYLLRSGGESLRSEEVGGKPLPYIGLRTSRDAPVHQRSNHTGEHCGSRRNHRRGGVYPRPFWRFRAWKTIPWEIMDGLHEKGLISDPATKAKSVRVTVAGREAAQAMFEKYLVKAPR